MTENVSMHLNIEFTCKIIKCRVDDKLDKYDKNSSI